MKKLLLILVLTLPLFAISQTGEEAMHVLASQDAGTTLKTSLLSLWAFDETTGTTMNDSHGSLDGTTNATINQTGLLDKAYSFDGSTDYSSVSDDASLSFTTGSADVSFSMSFWIKPSTRSGTEALMAKTNLSNPEYTIFINASNIITISLLTDNSNYINRISSASVTNSTWNHIVITYDGGEVETGIDVYINGSLSNGTASEIGTYTGMVDTNGVLYIATNGSSYYTGVLDQSGIWRDRELSLSDVGVIRNSGNGLAYVNW